MSGRSVAGRALPGLRTVVLFPVVPPRVARDLRRSGTLLRVTAAAA